jgi:membrane-bound serine protease (ClpP class)
MVVWSAVSVALYQAGSRALRRKPFITLPDMIDGRGRVVSPLDPEGLVRVKGELWVATSTDKKMDVGTNIIVVAQDGLKIVVRERKTLNPEKTR